jgi:hypothetical protein
LHTACNFVFRSALEANRCGKGVRQAESEITLMLSLDSLDCGSRPVAALLMS